MGHMTLHFSTCSTMDPLINSIKASSYHSLGFWTSLLLSLTICTCDIYSLSVRVARHEVSQFFFPVRNFWGHFFLPPIQFNDRRCHTLYRLLFVIWGLIIKYNWWIETKNSKLMTNVKTCLYISIYRYISIPCFWKLINSELELIH